MLTGQWIKVLGFALLVLGVLAVPALQAQETARRIHAGDTMPAFSLADVDGQIFTYDPNRPRVLGLVIMKTGQDQFERVMSDLRTVVEQLRSGGEPFDCVGVVSGPGAREFVLAHTVEARTRLPVLLDPDFVLWGKLGIIAAPTAIVVGANHEVQWTEAGYGYDFIPAFHAQMAKALGLGGGAEASVRVETLQNASDRARLERHVRMGRMLAQRGRLSSAIEELLKARALDPNAVDVVLELGELLCRAGRSQAALETAATAESKVKTDSEKARVLLISGWARRQMGEFDAAESLLSQAVSLDPTVPRALYELGKVYEGKGDAENALACYRKALARIFEETDAMPAR
ncbi:MAG: tetratricopeptide repeat protein [Sedimentisphaerales bacterium]|nr:tetratricopeptide repeat protein [Sedimentisphaerales bacterium]